MSTWLARSGIIPTALCCALLSSTCRRASEAPIRKAEVDSRHEPIEIRFSDPGNGGTSVLAYARREGILERELAKVNARIVWVPGAQAFSANYDAMNSGAINASGGAVSPIVGALAHNLKFKIFAISDPAAMKQAGILVPANSPIKNVKDLAGKRVAVNLAAHGDYMLLKALANEGVPAGSVTRVPIQPPDAAGAFASGKIDAWSTFGVFYSTAVRNGARVLVNEAELGSDDVSVHAASAAVLERNPAAFLVFVRVLNELIDLAHREPRRFQNVFTDKGPTALSGEELELAVDNIRSLSHVRVPTAFDKKRIANVANLFWENRSIDREISVDEIVFDASEAVRRKGLQP